MTSLGIRGLTVLLDARSGGAFSREFDAISRSQWESPARVAELQFARLLELLRHAEATVPFYSRRFAEFGVRAADIRAPGDLERLPILEKADVVADPDALLSRSNAGPLLTRKATGGSTGERMVFYRDAAAMARNFAHVVRNYAWTGFRLGDRHAFLWGAHFDLRAQQRISNRVINLLLRQRWFDAFHMNTASMDGYAAALRRWRPSLLSSYVTAATTLADYLEASGGSPLNLPSVATTAEVLFPAHRVKIQRMLGGAVFDRLGCREIGNTAHECSAHHGLHVNAEHTVAEVVDLDGHALRPGSEGDLLYTSLGNWCFPLIRYRVGDRAIAAPEGPCPCGRGLPKLAQVRGRVTDMLVTADGTKVHGEYFSHLFYGLNEVAEFRVLQDGVHELTVWLRLRPAFAALTARTEADVRAAFAAMFGAETEVEMRIVDEIPKSASGKHRFTESRVGTTQ